MKQKEILKIYKNNEFLKEYFDNDRIYSALLFAQKMHKGQKRKSGLDFIIHPISIAIRLWEKYHDEILVIAALLHDTVEDIKEISAKNIYEKFGEQVGFLVDGLNKREESFYNHPKAYFDDKTERVLWAATKDIRILLIRIADREHNLESLEFLKPNKQIRMAFETQAIYNPLKKILKYSKNLPINELQSKYLEYLIKNNINKNEKYDMLKLKDIFLKQTFKHFNEESFKIVYENSSQVTWKIEGWDTYDMICNDKNFKNKIEIIAVKSDGNNVKVDFKFKVGIVPNEHTPKMEISTFSEK